MSKLNAARMIPFFSFCVLTFLCSVHLMAQDEEEDVVEKVEQIVDSPTSGAIVVEGDEEALEEAKKTTMPLLPDGRIIVHTTHSETEERIFQALELQTQVEFPGNTLRDVVAYLAQQKNIPILINDEELEQIGTSVDDEVELILSNISLADAMNLLLRPLDLTYVVKNGVMEITTVDAARNEMETRIYNVRPLNVSDPESLADVLIYTTGEETWSEFGGNGAISFFNGSFIIKQNQETHREIEAILNHLALDIRISANSPEWPAKDRSAEDVSRQNPQRKQPQQEDRPKTFVPNAGAAAVRSR